jgi:hypothetical protein
MALVAALACGAGGCGTVNSGSYGVPLDVANRPQAKGAPPPVLVSASEAVTYSTPYLGLVEVTFENRTPVWKQVDRVIVDFGSPAKNQSVAIASADDIDAWERAIKIRFATQASLATTAIEVLGLGRALDAPGPWISQPQPVVAATPAAGAAADPAASPTPSYPVQYLLTTPFRIPPGLFAKRWILLSTPESPPGGCIDSMILSYETSDHATGRVLLPFKATMSVWQPACGGGVDPVHAM